MKCHYCDNQAVKMLVWLKDKTGRKSIIRLPWCGCDLMTALKKIWPTPYPVKEGVDYAIDEVDQSLLEFMGQQPSLLDHGGLNAQKLFEYLEQFTPEQRKDAKLYIRVAKEGQAFNIKSVDEVVASEYAFFGHSLPCLIFHTSQFAPPEPEDESEDE